MLSRSRLRQDLVGLFAGKDALFRELGSALGHCFGILQSRLIFGDVCPGLFLVRNISRNVGFDFSDLVSNGFCIELKEQTALTDILPFLKVNGEAARSRAISHRQKQPLPRCQSRSPRAEHPM